MCVAAALFVQTKNFLRCAWSAEHFLVRGSDSAKVCDPVPWPLPTFQIIRRRRASQLVVEFLFELALQALNTSELEGDDKISRLGILDVEKDSRR